MANIRCQHFYRPKRSFGQGNIFTPVCHSVHRGGGFLQIFFRGVGSSKFLWGVVFLQILGGSFKFSGGGSSKFSGGGGSSKFSVGGLVPRGCLQFFGGGGVSNFWNTVNVRPVRILLECILVTVVGKECNGFLQNN